MSQQNGLIIGLELEKNWCQVSYCHKEMAEPQTLFMENGERTGKIETVAYKLKGENKWSFGESGYKSHMLGESLRVQGFIEQMLAGVMICVEELEYHPADIFEAFLQYMLGQARDTAGGIEPYAIAVCTGQFSRMFLDIVKEKLQKLMPGIALFFMNREDCFIYYALSMKEELRRNDMALFDYEDNLLRYIRFRIVPFGNKLAAVCERRDTLVDNKDEHGEDEQLERLAMELFGKEIFSAVYLTGGNFRDEHSYERFVRYVCARRRVFLGQNLFSKGACYGAYDLLYGRTFSRMLLACKGRILYDVDIEFLENGVPKVYRIVNAGSNWYETEKSVDFIVCGNGQVKLNFTPVENRPVKKADILLEGFPKRPDRTTRITVGVSFENEEQLCVTIKDRGFGRLFKASEAEIIRKISLKED